MTDRFLAGLHPGFGTYGIWLSKAGVDVKTPGPAANFLLRSDLKYYQVVLSGTIFVPVASETVVAFPADLVTQPYVIIRGNVTSLLEYPSYYDAAGAAAPESNELNLSPVIYRDQFRVFNSSPLFNLYGFFMVLNRSIGS